MQVSIIIPYNIDRGFLSGAIASCENQAGFRLGVDYELIVQAGDYGVSRNYNDAIRKAKGKYIKGCAEDDQLLPNCLTDLYNFAESDDYDFVCANSHNFDSDGDTFTVMSYIPETVHELACENTIHGGTILYKREALLELGKMNGGWIWDENLGTAEEYELTLRMAAAGFKFGWVDSMVYRYRMGWHQKSIQMLKTDHESKLDRDKVVDSIQRKYLFNNTIINR